MELIPITVVIVAYGKQPLLIECVEAVLSSNSVEPRIVVVDNGHTGSELEQVRGHGKVSIHRMPSNIGFCKACNFGVELANTEYVALINPDVVVAPNSFFKLIAPLQKMEANITTPIIAMRSNPEVVNTAGNVLHPCGISYCGNYGTTVAQQDVDRNILLASGAALVTRKSFWMELGGLQEEFFCYYEDVEFSLRANLRGEVVKLVHDAIVEHDYEFGRHSSKMYLLYRNRLLLFFSLYRRSTYVFIFPIFLVHEALLCLASAKMGWGKCFARAWAWMITNPGSLKRVRRQLQSRRLVGDSFLLNQMDLRIQPNNIELPALLVGLQKPIEWSLQIVQKLISVIEKYAQDDCLGN